MWREPIFDRTNADTLTARAGQSNIDNHKGALNADDLNRIEGNFRYLEEHLKADGIFIPRNFRNYTETTYQMVEKKKLPDGYTQVEYIESTGTQYIDTGFKPNQDTRVVMDFDNITGGSEFFFGARTDVHNLTFAFCSLDATNIRSDFGSEIKTMTVASSENRTVIDKNGNSCKFGDYTITNAATTFQCDYPLYLLCANSAGSASALASGKLYSCQIYDNNTLVRDFIPCIKGEGTDSVAGLYDLVNGVFYTNAGTGVFSIGNTVQPEIVCEMQEVKTTYTDWQEQNLPWLSEISRIRANYNALVRLFLVGMGLPVLAESNFLDWQEVNDWERIAFVGKQMFENMEQEYRYCGMENSGGDRLL